MIACATKPAAKQQGARVDSGPDAGERTRTSKGFRPPAPKAACEALSPIDTGDSIRPNPSIGARFGSVCYPKCYPRLAVTHVSPTVIRCPRVARFAHGRAHGSCPQRAPVL